jgi:transposase
MPTTLTRREEYSEARGTLYMALELGKSEWRLGFTTGLGQKARERTMAARDVVALVKEIDRAKERFKLASSARVVSCYEAGRDGFWLHRFLVQEGIENFVVDSASIEVNRRAKRVKTDALDVRKLSAMLVRYDEGERKVWSVVRVPTVEAEDNRHLHRELDTLRVERTRATNRIQGLLAGQGLRLETKKDLLEQLKAMRLYDGRPLPPALHCRLVRENARIELLDSQIRELETDRAELAKEWEAPEADMVRQLLQLRGIGINSAWLFVHEFFGWRKFSNRRQVGALAGLTPTPYQSGQLSRDQGISKAGQKLVRHLAIEIAWGWVRFQPRSQLTLWYQERFGGGSSRLRRIGIVALARKLLIALWRYLETEVVPEGALLKA